MTRASIALGAIAIVLILLALALGYRARDRDSPPTATAAAATPRPTAPPPAVAHPAAATSQGFLYGRITTVDGATHEGRMRWGPDGGEAFWDDHFNGSERENPWLAHVPPEHLPEQSRPRYIFGFRFGDNELVGRLFLVRFGDVAHIEAVRRDVRVTLKSGAVFVLDRFEASDFDDSVRVWDGAGGTADLESVEIRSIDLLPTPALSGAPYRLHGTVRTRHGDFTGFVGWNRDAGVMGSDELAGRTADRRRVGVRFDAIRSIARRSQDSLVVTQLDGREVVLTPPGDGGHAYRGISVDDRRYGRVVTSWEAFDRVDFGPGGSGPAYGDFPAGHRLTGSVTTRGGRRLAGRLVYDLDESETVETLDVSSEGVDYSLPFGLIASIALAGGDGRDGQRATVTLHRGEQLRLERSGDLRDENAGMLVFVDGRERPEYVPWSDVERIDLDRPPAMYPPLGGG